MIEPPVRLAAMRRAASWPTRNTPSRLTLITSRHSSSVVLVKKAPGGDAGVVDEDGDGPQRRLGVGEGLRHRGAIGDVHGHRRGLAAAAANLGLELLQDIEAPRRERHLGAGLGQHAREMAAEAGGGPRHQRGLAVER